jgi:pheromone shutdown protein TraB
MIEDHNKHHLFVEDKEIILVGTAHVSEESADLVARVIEEEKPETVAVELCQSRYQAMTDKNRWQETDLIKVIKEKKGVSSSFQPDAGFLSEKNRKETGDQAGAGDASRH